MSLKTTSRRLFATVAAAIAVATISATASAYPVVSTSASWAITPPTSIPGVLEFTGPQGTFASQQNQVTGRGNTGLSGPTITPPPSFQFGGNYGMGIGYSGGSAGGTSAGSMSTLIQGAAGLRVHNASASTQSVTLSGTYTLTILVNNYTGDPPGLDLAPDGVGRGEVGISMSVNGTNYLFVDQFVNTFSPQLNVSNPWQFTFTVPANSDALVDAQIFAATQANSLEGSTPPLITASLAPGISLPNPLSVPEPASLTCLALGGLLLLKRRRPRN